MTANRTSRLRLTAALVAVQLLAGKALGITTSWTNPGTGNWATASNWSAGVPLGYSNDGLINNGGTAQITATDEIAGTVILGQNAATSGTLKIFSLAGFPGSLYLGNDIEVGRAGTGTLTLSGISSLSSDYGFIATELGSTGTVTLTGANADWYTNIMHVGAGGAGTLTVTGGANAGTGLAIIGSNSTAVGTATVTGTNSKWGIKGAMTVGYDGTGSLLITSGGSVALLVTDFGNTDYTARIGRSINSNGAVTVTGAGSSWILESGASLFVGVAGTGTLTIADHGTVLAHQISINPLSTLNIGSYSLSGLAAAGTLGAAGIADNGLLQFDHNDAITVATSITGSGQIRQIGPGTTTVANAPTFTGAFATDAGLLILPGPLVGSAYTANNGGTLRFDGSTLGGKTIRANAGGTVEYEHATVNGGFLRGSGTHAIIGGGTSAFNGVTTFNSTVIVQDGAAKFDNSINGGVLTSNAALAFDGVANAASGAITVNSTLATIDFTNNGVVTVNDGGTISNLEGNLVGGGGSRTTVNPGGAINLEGGATLELNGALLVNNGVITGPANVNYGSLAKGSGSYDTVNVFDGGAFSPGNSPGEVSVGSMSLNAGGRLVLEIRDFDGTPGVDFDEIDVAGNLDFNAGTTPNSKFTIALVTLDAANQPAPAANFHLNQPFSLSLFNVGGAINGFSADSIAFDLSGFENDLAGGTLAISPSGSGLNLSFQPEFRLLGDYNGNGIVGPEDYDVWKTSFGSIALLAADGNGNHIVDAADYSVWRDHLGALLGSGSGAALPSAAPLSAGVPEPSTLWILLAGIPMTCSPRRPKVS
jgi:T5SS/PEP-CTERM-associated repeat protein